MAQTPGGTGQKQMNLRAAPSAASLSNILRLTDWSSAIRRWAPGRAAGGIIQ